MKVVKLCVLELMILSFVVVLCLLKGGEEDIVLSGKIGNLGNKELLLYHEDGIKVDTIRLNEEGEFLYRDLLKDVPGTYMLYVPQTSTVTYLYLREGARVQYSFDAAHPQEAPVLKGNVIVESEISRKMNEEFLFPELELVVQKTFKEYLKEIDSSYNAIVELSHKTRDRKFKQKVLQEVTAKRDYYLYCFRAAYKLCISKDTDVQDKAFWEFAQKLDLNKIENARSGLLEMIIAWDFQNEHKRGASNLEVLQEVNKRVTNQEVIDYMAEECMMSALCSEYSLEELTKMYNLFAETCDDWDVLLRVGNEYENAKKALLQFVPGNDMIDLEFVDRDGNHLNLSSIKNNILYVDIWASWCGPCCYEMDYLKKMAQKYEDDSRILMISISIDDDKEAWLAKAPVDTPNWKQYWITERSREILRSDYNVTAIPRFMLFNGKGKIIDIHAPSPSDEERLCALFCYLLESH